MNRFREIETLQEAVRTALPGAAVLWLAAVRPLLENLTTAALSGEVSDAEFLQIVETTSASLPDLLETLDHEALATLLETGMGAAMASGLEARLTDES